MADKSYIQRVDEEVQKRYQEKKKPKGAAAPVTVTPVGPAPAVAPAATAVVAAPEMSPEDKMAARKFIVDNPNHPSVPKLKAMVGWQ